MSAAGIYVHIPFCRSKCRYCDFVSACGSEEKQRRYVKALVREIYTGREIYHGEADTLYIGGGTPSCLYKGAVHEIVKALDDAFSPCLKEFTTECNPDSFDREKAAELKDAGVTRISLGVQSLDDGVLKALGRRHDSEQAKEAVRLAVACGFDVSADLMLGLPGQTMQDVASFCDFAAGEGIAHVSAYMLKVEEGTPLARDVENGLELPSDDESAEIYDFAYSTLSKLGYERYETSNFCRRGKRCLHNMKYWTMGDYLAFGVAAHGKIGNRRYFNCGDVDEYVEAVESGAHVYETEELLSENDVIEESVMLGLRLSDGVDVSTLGRRFSFRFEDRYAKALKEAEKYIVFKDGTLKIKDEYALVANAIIGMFV